SPLDWLLAGMSLGAGACIAVTAQQNLNEGWEFAAPVAAQWVAFLFAGLVLEATRRAGGLVLAIVVTVVAFYPTFAGHVPAPFSGFQSTLSEAFSYHVYSSESVFGIP